MREYSLVFSFNEVSRIVRVNHAHSIQHIAKQTLVQAGTQAALKLLLNPGALDMAKNTATPVIMALDII